MNEAVEQRNKRLQGRSGTEYPVRSRPKMGAYDRRCRITPLGEDGRHTK